jgi:hypothetical protein
MRATEGLTCPECGRVAADERELLCGAVSRRKAGCGAVLMAPCVAVWVLLAVLLPGPWLAERRSQGVTEKMKSEMAASGGTAGVMMDSLSSREPELTGWRRWCFYGLRLAMGPEPMQLQSSFIAGNRVSHWDVAGSDNNLHRREEGDMWGMPSNWDEMFGWVHFVAHQWLCPVAHYGWYRVNVFEAWEVRLLGEKGNARQTVSKGVCEALEEMPRVQRVVLRDVVVDDGLVYAMVSRKSLINLEMDECDMGDSQFELLGTWGKIEELSLVTGREVRPEIWVLLGKWGKLQKLTVVLPRFQIVRVEGKAFAELLRSKTVTNLKLQGRVELDDARPVAKALKKSTVTLEPGCVFVLRGDEGSDVVAALRKAGAATEVMESGAERN